MCFDRARHLATQFCNISNLIHSVTEIIYACFFIQTARQLNILISLHTNVNLGWSVSRILTCWSKTNKKLSCYNEYNKVNIFYFCIVVERINTIILSVLNDEFESVDNAFTDMEDVINLVDAELRHKGEYMPPDHIEKRLKEILHGQILCYKDASKRRFVDI